ncbi:MAG: type VI secretion system baseplate subunit TssK [bacterium]
MRRNLPVPDALRWHEGMLLAPQHFQEQSARFSALLAQYAGMGTPYMWGICDLEVDEALLDHRIFRLQRLKAIMPDGLFVGEPPEQVDLAPFKADAEKGPIRIYLCVPETSVAEKQGAMARFVVAEGSPVTDSVPEAPEGQASVIIPRVKPGARLVVTEAGTGGLVRLPVAEIEYADSAFRLTGYVAPHVKIAATEAWCQPLVELCGQAASKVRGKANYLLEMIRSPVGSANRPRFEQQLHSLMAGLPAFETNLSSGEVHPYTLYVSLCTLAAHVAAVGSVDEVPRFPRYDHENIREIFESVSRGLFNTLDLGVQEKFTEYRFEGSGHHFQIPFREEWVGQKVVLGFLGQPTQEVIAWAESCYIGTDSHVESMSKNRDIGARRQRDDQQEGLRRRPGTVLFTLDENLRRIEPGEGLHVFNPVRGPNDTGPTRVVLYVKHDND